MSEGEGMREMGGRVGGGYLYTVRGREGVRVGVLICVCVCVCRSLEEGSLLKPSESMPDQAALMS